MAKADNYKTLETKIAKQRELVEKETAKLEAMENEYYRAIHDNLSAKATTAEMSLSDYLEAMGIG